MLNKSTKVKIANTNRKFFHCLHKFYNLKPHGNSVVGETNNLPVGIYWTKLTRKFDLGLLCE